MAAAGELKATVLKLGGRKYSSWQSRACTLDASGLRWKQGVRKGGGGHAVPMAEIESVHAAAAEGEAHGQPAARVLVVQCRPTHKGGKRYHLALPTEAEREAWLHALSVHLHAQNPAAEREEISFPGAVVAGRFGHHGTMCTCSFPGEYKVAWDELVASATDGELSTACVFLTQAEQGRHCTSPETGRCWCCELYGEPKPWGCEWFERWKALVSEAVEKGQMILVFYKEGHLARVGAEHTSYPQREQVEGELEWTDLAGYSFEQLKAMPGLGASQKGEVAYLKKIGASFMRVDVGDGAPDAEAAAKMLGERADGLDLRTQQGLAEGSGVALKLEAIGALERALKLKRALVAAEAEVKGRSHVDTLLAKMRLANLLKKLGERDEARALYTEVIAGYTE